MGYCPNYIKYQRGPCCSKDGGFNHMLVGNGWLNLLTMG